MQDNVEPRAEANPLWENISFSYIGLYTAPTDKLQTGLINQEGVTI